MRAIALLTLISFAAPAFADDKPTVATSPLPEVPQMPDEPLPEWHPPPPRNNKRALFLSLPPQLKQAQTLRQIGIWLSSLGWIAVFGGGIVYARAVAINQDIGHNSAGDVGDNNMGVNIFSPQQEDQRNRFEYAGLGTMIGGGVVAAIGFSLFTAGQWRITVWHKKRPGDPVPSMSGF
jgi:hypothetical protein